jgi:hypothetical protein
MIKARIYEPTLALFRRGKKKHRHFSMNFSGSARSEEKEEEEEEEAINEHPGEVSPASDARTCASRRILKSMNWSSLSIILFSLLVSKHLVLHTGAGSTRRLRPA